MALDIYYKEDILNALRGLHVASGGPASLVDELLNDPNIRAAIDADAVLLGKLLGVYRQGFDTALASVGLTFGLVSVQPQVEGQQREEIDTSFLALPPSVER